MYDVPGQHTHTHIEMLTKGFLLIVQVALEKDVQKTILRDISILKSNVRCEPTA